MVGLRTLHCPKLSGNLITQSYLDRISQFAIGLNLHNLFAFERWSDLNIHLIEPEKISLRARECYWRGSIVEISRNPFSQAPIRRSAIAPASPE